MARHKILGKIECPYVNKSGIACKKLGRYNSVIMAWNKQQKFANKNQYIQFLHNDGSKKHYVRFSDYEFMEWNTDEYRLVRIFVRLMRDVCNDLYRLTWKLHVELNNYQGELTQGEKKIRRREFEIWLKSQFLMQRFLIYWVEGANCVKENKKVPEKIRLNLKVIRDYFLWLSDQISDGKTPIPKPIERLYVKYVLPDIKKKREVVNQRQKNWPLDSKHIRNGIMG